MIEPTQSDYWTANHLSNIRTNGVFIGGAGIPLRVVLPVLQALNLTWFSDINGDYRDNFDLLGFDAEIATKFPKVKHKDPSPVKELSGLEPLDEFILSDEIRSHLNFQFTARDHKIKPACQVYFHDDCFFSIQPVDQTLMTKILSQILDLHNYYMKEEINWSSIIPFMQGKLMEAREIELKSDPRRHCMWIPQFEESKGLLWKWFRKGTVLIENGKAHFREDVQGINHE